MSWKIFPMQFTQIKNTLEGSHKKFWSDWMGVIPQNLMECILSIAHMYPVKGLWFPETHCRLCNEASEGALHQPLHGIQLHGCGPDHGSIFQKLATVATDLGSGSESRNLSNTLEVSTHGGTPIAGWIIICSGHHFSGNLRIAIKIV
jgi:hypothetical protein